MAAIEVDEVDVVAPDDSASQRGEDHFDVAKLLASSSSLSQAVKWMRFNSRISQMINSSVLFIAD